MRGVSEERCGHRDELKTKQLGRSGQLSFQRSEALFPNRKPSSFRQSVCLDGIISRSFHGSFMRRSSTQTILQVSHHGALEACHLSAQRFDSATVSSGAMSNSASNLSKEPRRAQPFPASLSFSSGSEPTARPSGCGRGQNWPALSRSNFRG